LWNLSGDEQEGESHRRVNRDVDPSVAGEQLLSLLRPMWLRPADAIKALPNCALFGLPTGCGLRISKALDLRLDDVPDDGLVVRFTKFSKSQLVPMHRTIAIADKQVTAKCYDHEAEDAFQSIEFTDYTSAL
jgi:integrase